MRHAFQHYLLWAAEAAGNRNYRYDCLLSGNIVGTLFGVPKKNWVRVVVVVVCMCVCVYVCDSMVTLLSF